MLKVFKLCFLLCLIITNSNPVFGSPSFLGPIVTVAIGSDPDIAVDSGGSLHIAYVRGGYTYYRKVFAPYTSKIVGAEYFVGYGGNPQITVDSKGNPHVVFGQAQYSFLSGSKFTKSVKAFAGWRKNLIAVDSKDRVYVLADRYRPRDVSVRVYKDGIPISGRHTVGTDNPGGVAVDASDTLHITWRNSATYYNTYSLAKGKGVTKLIIPSSGDFSWCSVNPRTNSIHAVATKGFAKGIVYTSKRNNKWGNSFDFGYPTTNISEPDEVNPVSTNDSQGYTYVTFRGRHETGYFVVIDSNDNMIGGVNFLDPEKKSHAGGKMTNPNVISNSSMKGAFVAWGTSFVYIRSIGQRSVLIGPMNLLLSGSTVITGVATDIFADRAILNGTVNALGKDTDVSFEYGTDKNYGSSVIGTPPSVNTSTPEPITGELTGLNEDSVYHYRIKAVSDGGVLYGKDKTFQTDGPPVIEIAPATQITDVSATLNATVSPNGADTTVKFEYGEDQNYGTTGTGVLVTGANGQIASFEISDLQAETTYHYRAFGNNGIGGDVNNDVYSGDMTFTTAGEPVAITEAASETTDVSATLNATINPNGAATKVTFEYGLDDSYGTTTTEFFVTGADGQTASIGISGLAAETTYNYRVVGNNGIGGDGGHNVYGDDMTFTTKDAPQQPTVTTEDATSITQTSATVNAMVNPNGSITDVSFEFGLESGNYIGSYPANESPLSGTTSQPASIDTQTALQDYPLLPGLTYYYRAVGNNGIGGDINHDVFGVEKTFTTEPLF